MLAILPITFQFIQYYTHANSSTTKYDKTVVKSATCSCCSSNQSETYTLSIAVPSLPPTDESTSNIVKVSYLLQVQICEFNLITYMCSRVFYEQILGSSFFGADDILLTIPIKIGTYPILVNSTTITQQPTMSNDHQSANNDDSIGEREH